MKALARAFNLWASRDDTLLVLTAAVVAQPTEGIEQPADETEWVETQVS